MRTRVSRRHFVGGLAATIGAFGTVRFDARVHPPVAAQAPARRRGMTLDEYDAAAKLLFNENPWGPSASVAKAMATAHRFRNRYGYPDGDILDVIAAHHGVSRDHALLGAGSREILEVAGRTFLPGGRKVVGVQPTFADVCTPTTPPASLADTAAMERTRSQTLALRRKTVAELEKRGYRVLPSETNFFMVDLGRPVGPVIEAFRSRGILVGRPFPPMTQHCGYRSACPRRWTVSSRRSARSSDARCVPRGAGRSARGAVRGARSAICCRAAARRSAIPVHDHRQRGGGVGAGQ